jgi:hypothetical protein
MQLQYHKNEFAPAIICCENKRVDLKKFREKRRRMREEIGVDRKMIDRQDKPRDEGRTRERKKEENMKRKKQKARET